MIRRPPRSTLSSSSAASDVYKRQIKDFAIQCQFEAENPECIDNSNDEACTARYEEMYQQYKQYVDSIFNTTQHKNYFSNKEDFKKGVEKQLRKLSEELGETELDDDLQQE
eukprot:TRINITY_DN414_c0_g1_i5.p3 TRINITY_DN414_c0_g1~~TRINITY_DN414_c0_g1_i5.p3  ORF type:complete len:111 (-),score=28.25 TRINITY_DN414_c0_g1_i5:88-420(-)